MTTRDLQTSKSTNRVEHVTGNQGLETKRESLIICDDNQDILRSLTLLLRRDYDLLIAKSAKECLSTLSDARKEGRNVDLVILDYELGDMPAEVVTREIKTRFPKTIVFLITGYDFDELGVSKLFSERLVDYRLRKPFGLEELKSKIAEIFLIER